MAVKGGSSGVEGKTTTGDPLWNSKGKPELMKGLSRAPGGVVVEEVEEGEEEEEEEEEEERRGAWVTA